MGSGTPEEPRSHIQYVRRHCVIRDGPLQPSRDPILTAQQLIESPLVARMPERDRGFAISDIRNQAIQLLPEERRVDLPMRQKEMDWHEVLKRAQAERLVWYESDGFHRANKK
ncbi:MAG: hypothetical protein R3C53_05100 [Pirellulaceae bacterium]